MVLMIIRDAAWLVMTRHQMCRQLTRGDQYRVARRVMRAYCRIRDVLRVATRGAITTDAILMPYDKVVAYGCISRDNVFAVCLQLSS